MANKKILKDAINKMAKASPKKEEDIPAHKVECPECGHKWTMGEDKEYEDEEDDES